MKFRTFGILVAGLILGLTTVAQGQEWTVFMPVSQNARWLTGDGTPIEGRGLALPVYLDLPARPYVVLGYVKVTKPEGEGARRRALEALAAAGKRHRGEALILIEPERNVYATGAVIQWLAERK